MSTTDLLAGEAAGVPFVARPPERDDGSTPVVIAWHLMDPPRTETAFAAAVPLDGLDAWRIYLGLPMCGSRTPPEGGEHLQQLAMQDAVMNVFGPISDQAAKEFPAAFEVLRERFGLAERRVAFMGGSMGSAVAQLVLLEQAAGMGLHVEALVLISPMASLRGTVDAVGQRFGVSYPWGDASLAVAARLEFADRADEFVAAGQPAVTLIVGEADDREFSEAALQLRAALAARYDDASRVTVTMVAGMPHALAEEPGLEPAPQTSDAATVDALAVDWLRRHLGAAGR